MKRKSFLFWGPIVMASPLLMVVSCSSNMSENISNDVSPTLSEEELKEIFDEKSIQFDKENSRLSIKSMDENVIKRMLDTKGSLILPSNVDGFDNITIEDQVYVDLVSFVDPKNGGTFENLKKVKKVELGKNVDLSRLRMSEELRFIFSLVDEVVLDDQIENIPSEFFSNIKSLSKINLPSNLKKIQNRLFRGCSNLTEVTIPKSVEKIEVQAFDGCSNLKKVIFEERDQESLIIESKAFNGTQALEDFHFPPSVKTVIPQAVIVDYWWIFGSSGVKNIYLSKELKDELSNAFEKATSKDEWSNFKNINFQII